MKLNAFAILFAVVVVTVAEVALALPQVVAPAGDVEFGELSVVNEGATDAD